MKNRVVRSAGVPVIVLLIIGFLSDLRFTCLHFIEPVMMTVSKAPNS